MQKPPSNDVTIDTIFSSAEYAKRILYKSYQTLPYGFPTGYNFSSAMYYGVLEGLTDLDQSYLTWDGPSTLYYNGIYNPGHENSTKAYPTKFRFTSRSNWYGVRHAWLFIQNVNRVPDMSEDEKCRLIAEAKIIIAIHYSEMMRNYGGLPIVDKAFNTDDLKLPARNTLAETVNFIVRLLDEASNTKQLPWALPVDEINNWDGRLTRAAAMALKVRVLLFVASPLFNAEQPYLDGTSSQQKMTWYGNYDPNRWNSALKASEDFFKQMDKEGYYGLVKDANYRLAFRNGYYKRGTTESLISVRRSYNAPGELMQSVRWGSSCMTKEYFDMFPMADGTEFDWNNPEHAKNPFINRDPRLYETILVDGDVFGGSHKAAIYKEDPSDKINYPKGEDYNNKNRGLDGPTVNSGFPLRKFVLDRQGEFKGLVVHWPYLRLAEIYLSYAEALNECDKINEAYKYVNEVRARVGLNGLKSGLSKEQMREEILRERACEFGWEEVRFYDLIRWKRASDFSKKLHGIDLYKNKNTNEYKIVVKELPTRSWQQANVFSSKWYLSAFPPEEIDKGYGMVQNPGWE